MTIKIMKFEIKIRCIKNNLQKIHKIKKTKQYQKKYFNYTLPTVCCLSFDFLYHLAVFLLMI